ncbi:MAG: MarR family transcriptional regulator [Deltaproteobacteria bacterium]|nr:MarR family transcriptional regulator [Deltaproteobacteria bacterium]
MATHYAGAEQEIQALNCYIKLARATHTASMRIHRHLKERRITAGQFGVLDALYFLGPLSQRDLAQKHLMSPGNMTMVVDHLEKRGLVSRERQTHDRRFVKVHLTEEGRKLFESVLPRHIREIQSVMSVLSPTEQDELGRLCRKLGTRQNR